MTHTPSATTLNAAVRQHIRDGHNNPEALTREEQAAVDAQVERIMGRPQEAAEIIRIALAGIIRTL